ncbi:MAG: hypothetical protein FGM34_06405 [Solirubrobacteraceae bacterium]|nr:hypothetical protein [Solirubrobacteraceae bacterium]
MLLRSAAATAAATVLLALPASASAGPGDPSRLWTYADGVTQRMEQYWKKRQQYYSGFPFRKTVSMLTLFSNARIARYEGPSRKDERIEPLARQLITWPTYITSMSDARNPNSTHPHAPGFTSGTGDEPGTQHVAISNEAMSALGLAVKSGALPRELEQEIAQKVYAVARGPRFSYPSVEVNQVNWQIGAWLATARVTGQWGEAMRQARAYLVAFVNGMHRPMPGYILPNLTSGLGLNYSPAEPASAPINQTSSTEYASVIFSGFDAYDEMLRRGMKRLPSGQEAKVRRWARRIITGEWMHDGWPNWDSGRGYERWQMVAYFAWCVEGLTTMSSSRHLVSEADRRRARWLLYRALDRYQWLVEKGLKKSTRYGIRPLSDMDPDVANQITDARLGAHASTAALAQVGAPGRTPGGWSWWDGERRRLTVSNPRYSAALITPINRIGYGGLEPARFVDSEGRAITSVGSTSSQAGMRASVGGRLVGLTQGRYQTVLNGIRGWRPRRVGGGSPSIGARGGAILVRHDFTPRQITTHYEVRARNARTELRIPFWGELTKRDVTKIRDGLRIRTENTEGTKVEMLIRSERPISGQWRSIGEVRSSPGTRTVFLVRGSSSGRTGTNVVMRPLS